MPQKAKKENPSKAFATHILLANLLREYSNSNTLYMGTDNNLKSLLAKYSAIEAKCEKQKIKISKMKLSSTERDAQLSEQNMLLAQCAAEKKRLNGLITCSTLCNALNAPYNKFDIQKIKTPDPDMVQKLTRFGMLRYPEDHEFDLRRAYLSNPVTFKSYNTYTHAKATKKALETANAALRDAKTAYDKDPNGENKAQLHACLEKQKEALHAHDTALKDLYALQNFVPLENEFTCREDTATGKMIYAATVGRYHYEYHMPIAEQAKTKAKGKVKKEKAMICVRDVTVPEKPQLELPYGRQQGVDVRSVVELVSYLPQLQAWSDKVREESNLDNQADADYEAKDDFGALMGFRLYEVAPETLFPMVINSPEAAKKMNLAKKDGTTRLYRVESSDRRQSLSMILTAYLPYISTEMKLQLEESMPMTSLQRGLYHDILDIDNAECEYSSADVVSDPLDTLDKALKAVADTKAHYEGKRTGKPNFWYEFKYQKWEWPKDASEGDKPVRSYSKNKDGSDKIIQMLPVQIVSSQGRIYLVGLRLEMPREKNRVNRKWILSNLRVDLISGLHQVEAIDPIDKNAQRDESHGTLSNPQNHPEELRMYYQDILGNVEQNMAYRNASPKMFSGTPETLILDCSPTITNVLVDTFSREGLSFLDTIPGPEDTLWNRISVVACWDGVRLFLLQNLKDIRLADLSDLTYPPDYPPLMDLCKDEFNQLVNCQAKRRKEISDLLFDACDNYSSYDN